MEPVTTLKRPISIDYSMCIICQSSKLNARLSKASDHGRATVKNTINTRRKLKSRDPQILILIDRLKDALNSAESNNLVWHKMCYAHFTDKTKLARLDQQEEKQQNDDESEEKLHNICNSTRHLRSSVKPLDWSKCIFC